MKPDAFTATRLWLAVFVLGIGALIGVLAYVGARNADSHARATANEVSCLQSRGPIRRFDLHVTGVLEFDATLVANAQQQLYATRRTTRRGSIIYRVRRDNLIRLRKAYRKERALSGGFPVPKITHCRSLGP